MTVHAKTTSLTSGADIKGTVKAALLGDIIELDCGEYPITSTITIDKSLEIRGCKYGIKAPGRSTVGDGIDPSTLIASDPAESTLIFDVGANYFVIYIPKGTNDVVIDGLTIT